MRLPDKDSLLGVAVLVLLGANAIFWVVWTLVVVWNLAFNGLR